ncbi:MraY family glycosyltransferase [Adhaeribacter rhizoryzae]|uniref:Undecaprenyl/decaprenyl-phosphate alpha-N-acetylglucosaminyl 1-phosphate transferase n=1 Tax=Adhaeribacter rhizoryzae TaxID=2607907 RepID=A0A5M6DMJ7_9BACT|nr:MraY family glycosyltransferase [Adhaeribacter rhizoryzae]KAA5548764.1 undecaprenyl/decaprenyl-phosphate alpha-N-acetylglucosaminyl 1-phosphate transferase [Adhaeribacter rhizoryzae]
MFEIFTSFLTAFLITYFVIPSVIRIAHTRKLFDEPDERKHHQKMIPALGGIAIFAGTFFSVLFWVDLIPANLMRWFILSMVIVFMIGIQDDIVAIRPVKKLIGELVASGLIIYYGNIRIYNLQGLLGLYELPYLVSFGLTLFAFIVIINAFNLIDGIDGLAGGIGIISAGAFGSLFWYSGQIGWAAVAFALVGALLAFLKFNFAPAKIFMGDCGSLFTGFLLAIMCVQLLDTPILLDASAKLYLPTPVIAMAILIVPLADTLRVFIVRVFSGKSPFHADRNHIHHLLLNLGLNHKSASCTLYCFNLFFIVGILGFLHFSINYLFLIVVLAGYILISIPKVLLYINKQEVKKGTVINA